MAQIIPVQAPSAHAEQLSGTYQLGTFQKEYQVKLTKTTLLCGIGALVLAGGIGYFAYTLLTSPRNVNDLNNAPFVVGVSVIFLLIALYCLCYPLLYRSWHVYVYADGFAFTRGGKLDAFRWEQVESMWQRITRRYMNGIYYGTEYKYTIRGENGQQVILTNRITDVGTLGETISERVTRVKLPSVIDAFQAGSVVSFGQLSVSTQGVSNSKEWVSWDQIKDIRMNRGIVTVKKEGKWLNWSTIQVADIPNLFIFMALVRAIMQQKKA